MDKKSNQFIPGYVLGGSVVLFIIPYGLYLASKALDPLIPMQLIPSTALRMILAAVIFGIGLWFGLGSNILLNVKGEGGPLQFGDVEISPKTKHLVVTGLYRYTRNPMLFGTWMLYCAWAVYLNSITAFIIATLLIIFMLVFLKKVEEPRLVKDFGSEYEEYRRKVSMFFPAE